MPEEKKKGGFGRALLELVIIVAVALALAWVVTNFVAQPYEIPSESMTNTIEVGDRVLSEKISGYSSSPKAGDIVTFTTYEDELTGEIYMSESEAEASATGAIVEKVLIKRVIATGGQTVSLQDGHVYVDGQRLTESYTQGKESEPLNGSSVELPYTVPEGELWVMGDNRTNSKDSRWFGSVPVDNVTGRAFFRYWPFDRIGSLD